MPGTGSSTWILVGLATAQFLGSCGQIMMATLSGIIGALLAPTPQLATLPVTAGILGVATAAWPAAALRRQFGCRPVFVGGLFWAAAGAVLAAVSIQAGSFAGYCVGCFMMGNNMAFLAQYRFAAAELVAPALVSRAISGIMLGMLASAVVAPWLALKYRALLDVDFAGSFAVLLVLYVAAAALIVLLPLPGADGPRSSAGAGVRLGRVLAAPSVQLAIVAAAAGYGVMSLIMTATPISMHVMDEHSVEATAGVIRAHVLAMFTPSLFSGWLIQKLGIRRMLWFGVLLELACIAIATSGHGVWHYRAALVTLGAGWNFLFVAGTTLLTTSCSREEATRVQGVNDMVMFGTMAVSSLSAGALLYQFGWESTNLVAIALTVLIVVALLRDRSAA